MTALGAPQTPAPPKDQVGLSMAAGLAALAGRRPPGPRHHQTALVGDHHQLGPVPPPAALLVSSARQDAAPWLASDGWSTAGRGRPPRSAGETWHRPGRSCRWT